MKHLSAIYRIAIISLLLHIAAATVCYPADIAPDPGMPSLPEGHNNMLTANAAAAATDSNDNGKTLIIRIPLPTEEVIVLCAVLGAAILGITTARLRRRKADGRGAANGRALASDGRTCHDTGSAYGVQPQDTVVPEMPQIPHDVRARNATAADGKTQADEPQNEPTIRGGAVEKAPRTRPQGSVGTAETAAAAETPTAAKAPNAPADGIAEANTPQTQPASASDRELASRLEEFVAQHMHNVDLSVDDIAAAMCMSRSTLFRRMKQIYSMNPNEYLRQRRLSYAAELLQQNKYSISDVCLLVGFNSPSYFSSCFKKQYNVLPKDYRVR